LKYKLKEYFSANQRNCLNEPILLQLSVEYKLVSDLLQPMTTNKNSWINVFRNCFWHTSLLYPTYGCVSFISRPSQMYL